MSFQNSVELWSSGDAENVNARVEPANKSNKCYGGALSCNFSRISAECNLQGESTVARVRCGLLRCHSTCVRR